MAVPRYNIDVRSASGASTGAVADDFSTGTLSPVSADSSVRRLPDLIRRASAGTRSPALRMMTSPGTRSAASTFVSCPSRRTRADERAWRRNASRARPAFHSVVNPTSALTTRTTTMARASTVSPVTQAMSAATASNAMMRLANCCRKMRHAGRGRMV